MSKPWDIAASETVGKALPNEFSKWSSWTRFVPYIGQILQILGGVDAGTTAYSDIYNEGVDRGYSKNQSRMKAALPAIQSGISTGMGRGSDPGQFGSSGNKLDPSWQNYIMNAGNLFGSYKSGNAGGMLNSGSSIYNDISGKGNYGTDVYKDSYESSPAGIGSLVNLFGNQNAGGTDNFLQSQIKKNADEAKQKEILQDAINQEQLKNYYGNNKMQMNTNTLTGAAPIKPPSYGAMIQQMLMGQRGF